MSDDRTTQVEALLAETETAHGAYEAADLGGVYDRDWPSWYAAYAVDHGLEALLGRSVTVEELSSFLTRAYGEFERTESKTESWQTFIARRLVDQA
jgi:hypothetical protein